MERSQDCGSIVCTSIRIPAAISSQRYIPLTPPRSPGQTGSVLSDIAVYRQERLVSAREVVDAPVLRSNHVEGDDLQLRHGRGVCVCATQEDAACQTRQSEAAAVR
jgi:hypothetical protein